MKLYLRRMKHLMKKSFLNPLKDDEQEIPGPEPEAEEKGQGAHKHPGPEKGQVKKLTDYFNKMGSLLTPKAPRKIKDEPGTPKTPKSKKTPGGISKSSNKKRKTKLEEPQRAKMELALRNFLKKKPPDENDMTKEEQ